MQKASCELNGMIDGGCDRIGLGDLRGFCCVRDAVRCRITIVTDRVSPAEHRMDNPRARQSLLGLPELAQVASLNFE
jgi:hypothetical protein